MNGLLSLPAALIMAGVKIDVLGTLDEWVTRSQQRQGVDYFEWETGGGGAWPQANLLRYYGVSFFGCRGAFETYRGLHVPRQQGKWAEYLLRRVDTPLTKSPGYCPQVEQGMLPYGFNVPRRQPGLTGLLMGMMLPVTLPYPAWQTEEAKELFASGKQRARFCAPDKKIKYSTNHRWAARDNRATHNRMQARPNTPVKRDR